MAFGFSGSVVARAKAIYEADTRDLEAGSRRAQAEVNRGAKAIDKDLRDVDSRWERVGKSAGLTGKAIGAGLAVAGPLAAAGLYKAVQAASDLDEQLNKTRVVFGAASQEVISFSETTAESLGISQRATLEATGTFGNMLVPMGFAREEAAQMSVRMVQLAADMASFNNASPERTLEALRSGLAGETEPLRAFGVFLNDARLKQEALNLKLWDGKGALDANAKAAATYSIILKDTKDAQGDFARTSDSLANQQRIARASLEDLAATVGKALLPIVTDAITEFTEFLTAIQKSGKASEIADGLIDALRSTVDALEGPARNTARALDAIADAVGGWENAFQLILAGLLAKKVADLAGAFTGLAGSSAAAGATGAALGIGGAASRSALLLANLNKLARLGAITIVVKAVADGDVSAWEAMVAGGLLTPGPLPVKVAGAAVSAFVFAGDRSEGTPEWKSQQAARRRQIDQAYDRGDVTRAERDELYRKYGLPLPRPGASGDSARDKAAATAVARGGIQLTTSQKTTHQTSGLAGFPAKDWFAVPGTAVRAPEDGRVVKLSGSGGTSGQVYGWSLYYVGDETGNTYFITHLAKNRAPVGSYRKGDVLGYVSAWDGGAAHAHVGIKTGGAAPGASGGGQLDLSGDVEPAAATGKKTGGSSKAAAPRFADRQEVQTVASQVRYAYSRLADVPADAAKQLRPGLQELQRILGKPVTSETLREVERQAAAYARQIGRILEADRLEEKWRGQKAKLQRLLELDVFPPAREAELRKQVAAMDKAVAAAQRAVVPTPAQLAAIKRGQAAIAEAIEEGLERARDAVDAAKDRFEDAWGRFTDRALAAFDAQTQRLLAGMRVRVRSVVDGVAQEWEFGAGFKTPSEQILEAEESARAKAAHEKTMAAARKRVEDANAAVLAAEQEGGEQLQTAKAEQAAALAALEDLEWQERRALLTAAAAEERRIAEGRLTDAQALEQARRDVLRGEFQAELVELGQQIVTRKLSYDDALGELQKLFAKYEVPFEAQGSALTTALSIGMQAALGVLEEAIDALVAAVDNLNRALTGRVTKFEDIYGRIRQLGGATDAEAMRIANAAGGAGGIPGFASGGEVSRRTLAWIGEAGREWVVPEGKIPPHLRPTLVPLLRRIIRGGVRPGRGLGGILELAGGGEFGGRGYSPILYSLEPTASLSPTAIRHALDSPAGMLTLNQHFHQTFNELPRDPHAHAKRTLYAMKAAL
jgi:hypothetical protein